MAFEAFGHWKISGVREGLDAALEFLQDPAIHHALARVAVGVVEQARGDLTLDGADVPEAFRAHERVASIVLLLDAHARRLAQHALALGKVPRREQPAASVRVRSRHGDVAVAWIVWQEEAVVVGSGASSVGGASRSSSCRAATASRSASVMFVSSVSNLSGSRECEDDAMSRSSHARCV